MNDYPEDNFFTGIEAQNDPDFCAEELTIEELQEKQNQLSIYGIKPCNNE
jgi:hypothetical protein